MKIYTCLVTLSNIKEPCSSDVLRLYNFKGTVAHDDLPFHKIPAFIENIKNSDLMRFDDVLL